MMKNKANLLITIQFVLLFALLGVFLALPRESTDVAVIIGLALIVLSGLVFVLAILAHQLTNRNIPRISPEPNPEVSLVQTGIYGVIRHPLYTGVLLASFGMMLMHGHLLAIGLAVLIAAFFTYKSMFEESWLSQVYPQYAAYCQRTGRFIPPVLRFLGRS